MVEVPYTAEYNVFAVESQHSEQPKSINNTHVMEKDDNNVIPDSSNMCDNENQAAQNADECDDERVTLANLIANLKLDIDENKKIQKQLKKANASLTQELKECKSTLEQMKNDTVCKEKASNVFLKEREQHFKIQDLKAQLQDKNIAIRKPPLQPIRNQPVVRQSTTYKSKQSQLPRHRFASQVGVSCDLTKLVTPHSWPQVRKSFFAEPYDVNAPGPSRNRPKHVSFQSPRESVGSNDMVHNYYLEEAKKKAQLHKDKALNTKPKQPRNQKPFLKLKDLACPTCKKCIYSANHDECILKYLSKKSDSKKHDRQIPIGQKFSPNKSFNVYLKTTPPRSGLTWKPTGRIFTQVSLKWIPIRNPVETRYNTNDSASPLGKETHNPKTVICANSSCLSTGTSMASKPISSRD
ncbi:hypothetical protein Tco_0521786 [Tanacetum coccineum]